MRASKFVLVAFAFAGIFLAIGAASAFIARAMRAQFSPSHHSELGISKHRHAPVQIVASFR